MIRSARSVSYGVMPGGFERHVQPRLVGGHGLDLDDLRLPCALDDGDDDAVGLVGVARPVDVAAGRGAAAPRTASGSRRDGAACAALIWRAGVAQRLPVGHLADDARALVADDVGRVADVAAQLRVRRAAASRPSGNAGAVVPRRRRESLMRPVRCRREDLGDVDAADAVRLSRG